MANQEGGADPPQVAGETLRLPEPAIKVALPWRGRPGHPGGWFLGQRNLQRLGVLVRLFRSIIGEGFDLLAPVSDPIRSCTVYLLAAKGSLQRAVQICIVAM